MDIEVIKKILNKFLIQLSKTLNEVYGTDLKFTIHSVSYFINLSGNRYLHVFIDTDPIVDLPYNKKFITHRIKSFLTNNMSISDVKDVLVELDKRPLYNIDEEILPFKEEKHKNNRVRTFSENVGSEELKWHFDMEDRMVKPLHSTNWMIQIDNKLPIKLKENKEIFIPKGVYHRLIKGDGKLKVNVRFV